MNILTGTKTKIHGFPARIHIPRHKAPVRILMKDGIPCDALIDVTIRAKSIGMRDERRWNGGGVKTDGKY